MAGMPIYGDNRTAYDIYGGTALPNWRTSPTGEIWQEYHTNNGPDSKEWRKSDQNAFTQFGLTPGGDGGGSASGGGAMGALSSVASGTGAPGQQTYQADDEADRAARTAAKERAGLRLQSSMQGLDAELSGRGIKSSGLRSKRASDLYAASASDEATSERERLDLAMGRRADISNRNADAQSRWAETQMNAQLREQDRRDRLAAEQRNIAMTLISYGMRY